MPYMLNMPLRLPPWLELPDATHSAGSYVSFQFLIVRSLFVQFFFSGHGGFSMLVIIFSRGHATLHLAVLVGPSVTFLNCERFLHYRSCPTVRDWIAVYPALFLGAP